VPGARIDVRQLETGKPVHNPLEVRISGDDIATLRAPSHEAQAIFRGIPIADRIRDDWGSETPRIALRVDPERARQRRVITATCSTHSRVPSS
jgi:multidrug efflux pump subunit AcrB